MSSSESAAVASSTLSRWPRGLRGSGFVPGGIRMKCRGQLPHELAEISQLGTDSVTTINQFHQGPGLLVSVLPVPLPRDPCENLDVADPGGSPHRDPKRHRVPPECPGKAKSSNHGLRKKQMKLSRWVS